MKVTLSGYSWGAGVATELVNTAPLVRRSTGEVLVAPLDLARFLTEHGIRLDAQAQALVPTENDLAEVRDLRQEIRDLLAVTHVDELVEGTTALIARTAAIPTLHRDGEDRWQWSLVTPSRACVADELAMLAGAGLLGAVHALGHARFRHCASSECDGMFVDTSKAGRRRYCMPEVCGNRLNVARHRARHR